jgi:hypothetical protein
MTSSRTPLQAYTKELLSIFKRAPNKHEAHHSSRRVLLDMAADPACLRAGLAAEIQRPGGLNRRHFPSLDLPIEHNAYFTLVANCFLPLQSGATDVTTNSIHHHGHLLLTSVTTFGPGYEHWRFTTPEPIDPEQDLFSIELLDREPHGRNHVAFVDSFMPHAVMYPASLTVTFALWSSQNEVTWWDHLKRVRALQARSNQLRKIVRSLRLSRSLRLNVPGYFDYYPAQQGFKGMRERVQFMRGPNENYLHTLFHILQRTSNEDLAPDDRRFPRGTIDNPRLVERLARDLRRGMPMEPRYSAGIHWLEHMNFQIQTIERALETLKSGPSRPSLDRGARRAWW